MISEDKQIFRSANYNPLDHYFASRLLQLADSESLELYLAGGLTSHQASKGHVCLDLEKFCSQKLEWQDSQDQLQSMTLPGLEEWKQKLQNESVVGLPEENTPLIIDSHRGQTLLYLNRYWHYEQNLASSILDRAQQPVILDEILLQEGLQRLFPPQNQEKNLQRSAVEIALQHQFCIISGGPGTGKTSVVIKILSLLIQQAKGADIHIALTAPTGKAAARLKESVVNGKQELLNSNHLSREEGQRIPESASTIHRLLGVQKNSVYFKNNHEHPLSLDCLVVDEASMVDLALMSKLLDALPAKTRLILLGDKNQLSSVEAGSVLGDLCEEFEGKSASLEQCIIHLQKSHRFDDTKGVGLLSREINQNSDQRAWEILENRDRGVTRNPLPVPSALKERLKKEVLEKYRSYLVTVHGKDAAAAFKAFKSFMVLSATRRGLFGSNNINRVIENLLREENLIPQETVWFPGRPIMITRNDYNLNLYNGDIGIILTDPQDNRLRTFFESDGGFRRIAPARLPEHETVFAMTIHKSQGSEFDEILLILPEPGSEPFGRELIYTGVTRSRNAVNIWTEEKIFKSTVQKRCERSSGLKDKLRLEKLTF
ncbi:MAG: exodeoxyribonuclease V subunit alpha [SAR324 cluster bacterium]|nr:exodeoxyribonuclease V subunit alpha [SAR324 cluster bacterium]